MVERAVELNSRFARHGASLATAMSLSQYSGLTAAPHIDPIFRHDRRFEVATGTVSVTAVSKKLF